MSSDWNPSPIHIHKCHTHLNSKWCLHEISTPNEDLLIATTLVVYDMMWSKLHRLLIGTFTTFRLLKPQRLWFPKLGSRIIPSVLTYTSYVTKIWPLLKLTSYTEKCHSFTEFSILPPKILNWRISRYILLRIINLNMEAIWIITSLANLVVWLIVFQ